MKTKKPTIPRHSTREIDVLTTYRLTFPMLDDLAESWLVDAAVNKSPIELAHDDEDWTLRPIKSELHTCPGPVRVLTKPPTKAEIEDMKWGESWFVAFEQKFLIALAKEMFDVWASRCNAGPTKNPATGERGWMITRIG